MKALNPNLSRPSETFDEFCKLLNADPEMREKVERMRDSAIKVNKL